MYRLAGCSVIFLGLVACTRTPDAGTEPAASPTPPGPSAAGAASAGPTAETTPGGPHGRRTGGSCEYVRVPGTATVTAIEADDTAGADCKNAKKVTLSFTPTDATAAAERLDGAFQLTVGGMGFVATGCVDAYAITVGAKFPTVRGKIASGTCSPLHYDVAPFSSAADIEKCVAFCGG
ncbi:MAG: hypothetical protein FJ104_02450 [Deltaproteobacteria bacterium]|nr:hypothetical protein [Deltaproteobacteria bacterium]